MTMANRGFLKATALAQQRYLIVSFAQQRAARLTTLATPRPLLSLTEATRSAQLQQQHGIAQRARVTSSSSSFYSTSAVDQSLPPLARSVIATTHAIKNLLIFSTSTLAIGYFFWAGTHAYLEQYKCPSPAGVSSQVQHCLHGAWVREEISPDPDVAEVYLQKALEFARKDLETLYAKSNNKNDEISFLEIEKDKALVEIQNRLARFYGRVGRDEQAATIWTRLWRLADKQSPRTHESPSGSSFLGSLFGGNADRPLITKQDGVAFAKHAADCWMRMGEYNLAEEALGWTLSTVTSSSDKSSPSIDEVGLLSTLGALYVRQSKFDYALSLFVKGLQLVQGHRANAEDITTQDRDMWHCREAILMNSIGETLFGASSATATSPSSKSSLAPEEGPVEEKKSSSWKFWSSSSSSASSSGGSESTKATTISFKTPEQKKKEEEALGWMQKAIAMAKEKSGQHRDCDECAALGLSNLGLIYEMDGETQVALQQFREAVMYATKANDYVGLEDYKRSIVRLTERIASATENSAPLTTTEPSTSTASSSSSPSPSSKSA